MSGNKNKEKNEIIKNEEKYKKDIEELKKGMKMK